MAVSVLELRRLLDPPVPVSNVLQFSRLNCAGNEKIEPILDELFCFLPYSVGTRNQHIQLKLFDHTEPACLRESNQRIPGTVRSLSSLVEQGLRYMTIYADPPWP